MAARPAEQHTFLTNVREVKEMEQDLVSLLAAFNEGRLHAFGSDERLREMSALRDEQQALAALHREAAVSTEVKADNSSQSDTTPSAQEHFKLLIGKLDDLCGSVQELAEARGSSEATS